MNDLFYPYYDAYCFTCATLTYHHMKNCGFDCEKAFFFGLCQRCGEVESTTVHAPSRRYDAVRTFVDCYLNGPYQPPAGMDFLGHRFEWLTRYAAPPDLAPEEFQAYAEARDTAASVTREVIGTRKAFSGKGWIV